MTAAPPLETPRVIRLAAKIAWRWPLPPDPAIEARDLCQEAILAGLAARDTWQPERGLDCAGWVQRKVRWRLYHVCAAANPRRRTHGQRYVDDDPRRDAPLHFSELAGDWEPAAPGPDCAAVMTEAMLKAAIDRLPERQRAILTGIILEDREACVIGEELGISDKSLYRAKWAGLRAVWVALHGTPLRETPGKQKGKPPTSHCPRGHERAGDNLGATGACKACAREWAKARYWRQKEGTP